MKKLIAVAVALSAYSVFAADTKGPRVTPDQLKWEQPFGAQGPSFAWVNGDQKSKGAVSFFLKVPAGGDSGWHTHSSTYEGVVIKGNFSAQGQGDAAETALPVGSYFGEPGKKNHRNGCSKDGDCLMFV